MFASIKKKKWLSTDRTDWWLPRGGVGGGMDWKVGVRRYKLLYIEWINNHVLLYSTENYIQYIVLEIAGKSIMCVYWLYMFKMSMNKKHKYKQSFCNANYSIIWFNKTFNFGAYFKDRIIYLTQFLLRAKNPKI